MSAISPKKIAGSPAVAATPSHCAHPRDAHRSGHTTALADAASGRGNTLVRRALWLHAWTDRALLVSPDSLHSTAEEKGAWLPRSQVTEIGREPVENPMFGTAPHIGKILGTMLTFDAPAWLLRKNGLLDEVAP